jgi:hypothetical protein
MKVDIDLQEILSTIQRNQQQIDLLTANNTQLVNYLLHTGATQALQSMPNGGFPQLAAPLVHTTGRKRRAKLIEEVTATPEPTTPKPSIWTPERRAKLSKAMKARFKRWGSLQRPTTT